MSGDANSLPKTVQRVCDLIGYKDTMRLVEAVGGTRLYIPKRPKPSSRISIIVGLSAASLLAKEFGGGERFEIPRCVRVLTTARNERIRSRRAEGCSIRMLALEFGMTERHITLILKGVP